MKQKGSLLISHWYVFGFYELDEITVCSMNKIGDPLFRRGVELVDEDKSITITIRHSKPDQVGRGNYHYYTTHWGFNISFLICRGVTSRSDKC